MFQDLDITVSKIASCHIKKSFSQPLRYCDELVSCVT